MRKPKTAREARAAFAADPRFTVMNGRGSHVKVFERASGRLIATFNEHPGRDLSPGVRCHIVKVLVKYGLLAALVLGVAAWLI